MSYNVLNITVNSAPKDTKKYNFIVEYRWIKIRNFHFMIWWIVLFSFIWSCLLLGKRKEKWKLKQEKCENKKIPKIREIIDNIAKPKTSSKTRIEMDLLGYCYKLDYYQKKYLKKVDFPPERIAWKVTSLPLKCQVTKFKQDTLYIFGLVDCTDSGIICQQRPEC